MAGMGGDVASPPDHGALRARSVLRAAGWRNCGTTFLAALAAFSFTPGTGAAKAGRSPTAKTSS